MMDSLLQMAHEAMDDLTDCDLSDCDRREQVLSTIGQTLSAMDPQTQHFYAINYAVILAIRDNMPKEKALRIVYGHMEVEP